MAALCVLSTSALAEPKPKPVDIKPIRDQLIVLQDADGGVYVVLPGSGSRVFYGVGGRNKNLYEQPVIGRSSDSTAGTWDVSVWAPRVPNLQPGSVQKQKDGSFRKWCGGDNFTPLTRLSADQSKVVIDKGAFLSTAMMRRPYLLARDDGGVYYYVDVLRKEYGGKGYRVFIGKKGAMKQKPLSDVAIDSAGDVFATKTGDLRIVRDTSDSSKATVAWVKGEKRTTLFSLDVDVSSQLIFSDLGVYGFIGSICETP